CRMLLWLSITPFGADVEPDVYCKNAMSPALTPGSFHAEWRLCSTMSVATHRICRAALQAAMLWFALHSPAPSVITTLGCASLIMDLIRALRWLPRTGFGG